MRLRRVQISNFKRFTNLAIEDLPETARLVVLVGPNGNGKSSLFDAFRFWQQFRSAAGGPDQVYHKKDARISTPVDEHVRLTFFQEPVIAAPPEYARRVFYIRSSYRHEPEFRMMGVQGVTSDLEAPRVNRLVDPERIVSDNYNRLLASTVRSVYAGDRDGASVRDIRDELIGEIRAPMGRMFERLQFTGIADPFANGTFIFEKGTVRDFPYVNLSSGEKAAFDIILDLVLKRRTFHDTVYCIDEPDLHLHTELQRKLLREIFLLTPANSQMWIASHSIGMMSEAKRLAADHGDEVVFLDFGDEDFDQHVVLRPRLVSRDFWSRILETALDDMANLVAPRRVVLCEGKAVGGGGARHGFDASIYRRIFEGEFPDTDFVSVGNAHDVQSDRMQLGRTIQTLVGGTEVIRLIDRDDRSETEVKDLMRAGYRCLTERSIENYLFSDEVLAELCNHAGRPDLAPRLMEIKATALENARTRGASSDNLKDAAGEIYNGAIRLLDLHGAGNDASTFMRDTLASLLKPGMEVYRRLRADIFG